jgi:hypothetical protein
MAARTWRCCAISDHDAPCRAAKALFLARAKWSFKSSAGLIGHCIGMRTTLPVGLFQASPRDFQSLKCIDGGTAQLPGNPLQGFRVMAKCLVAGLDGLEPQHMEADAQQPVVRVL